MNPNEIPRTNDRPCKECIWHTEDGCWKWDCEPIVRSEAKKRLKTGKWNDEKVAFYRVCSECGCGLEYAVDTFLDEKDHYNYCPNCGAKMEGEADA